MNYRVAVNLNVLIAGTIFKRNWKTLYYGAQNRQILVTYISHLYSHKYLTPGNGREINFWIISTVF